MTNSRIVRLSLLALLGTIPARLLAEAVTLPTVPATLRVGLFASEPAIRNPAAMAFDGRGRLFVGQGPQYRNPNPETPPDSVIMLTDADGNGVAESARTFAKGFNSIQGLAWHGRDLWVGNSPDLTVVRDLDGDDVADEYIKVYTDLGNLEHANHGHTWGPDGKLYFSQGTSKGLTQPGRVAPLPFRKLWGVEAPPGTPDLPPAQVFKSQDYRHTYQDPVDDWGREGGVLRSDDMGKNLEIVSRGMRNPWDIAFDSGFNWLATDNDQSEGDRILMPFFNAHFGWGHLWSTHWTGLDHPPTAPVSGSVFDGSGTGLIYYDHPQFPPEYRGVWFINDWLRKTTFLYRPTWDGALPQPASGRWQPFIVGGGAARAVSLYGGNRVDSPGVGKIGSLYKPVDIVIGPDGALYVSGWGAELNVVWKDGEQANEGRIFRIFWPDAPKVAWNTAKRSKPLSAWSADELIDDLGSALPVWNIDAQDELVRRGPSVLSRLQGRLAADGLRKAAETWVIWTIGRMDLQDRSIDGWISETGSRRLINARIQAIRIMAHRIREARRTDALPPFVLAALQDPEARVRFAAVQAIAQSRQENLVATLQDVAAVETDRLTFYASWHALRQLASARQLDGMLTDSRPGVRRAGLLALAEDDRLDRQKVQRFIEDTDPAVSELAAHWVAKRDGNPLIDIYPRPGVFVDSVDIKLTPGIKPASLRFTTDGSEPTLKASSGQPGRLTESTRLKVALFVNDRQVGNTLTANYRKRESGLQLPSLGHVSSPTKAAEVLSVLTRGNPRNGHGIFTKAGCVACHQVGDEGKPVGPNLSTIGDRNDADSLIRSILTPNQIVVEGYSLLTVATKTDDAFAGILAHETDRLLTLVQMSGETVSIEKSKIVSRQSSHQSPMPAYDQILTPIQVADLVSWLMQQRSPQLDIPLASDTASFSVSDRGTADFGWKLEAGRLALLHGGKAVATYVFSDSNILRPYLENLRAPSGVQLTRNNPLQASDATDHSTMHPGLWLGFGTINGQDFWRNKGRIRHVGFTRMPRVSEGVISFATENQLIAVDGSVLGRQIIDISLHSSGLDAYLIAIETTLQGENIDLVFGDQEEMGLGVRVETSLTEKAGGWVTSSAGIRGAKAVWGTTAVWAAYTREWEGRIRGVAVFPAASNPTPTWWHSRDYGVIVANGFGKRVLPPTAEGKLVIKGGDSLRLRYGVLLFDAPVDTSVDFAAVSQRFQ